ncbi:5-aminolevulinate synthase, nonspecific, mitochondrial, partial [Ascosphaera atra]
MESLISQSRHLCPFLHRTSPATLRTLSTATSPAPATASSPGGGTISNLQLIARRCPVMSKALAVQGSRMASLAGQRFGGSSRAARTGAVGWARHAHTHAPAHGRAAEVQKRGLHSSGKNDANVGEPQAYGKYARKEPIPAAPAANMATATNAANADINVYPANPPPPPKFDYESFYQSELSKKHADKSYRYFNNINRLAQDFPRAH